MSAASSESVLLPPAQDAHKQLSTGSRKGLVPPISFSTWISSSAAPSLVSFFFGSKLARVDSSGRTGNSASTNLAKLAARPYAPFGQRLQLSFCHRDDGVPLWILREEVCNEGVRLLIVVPGASFSAWMANIGGSSEDCSWAKLRVHYLIILLRLASMGRESLTKWRLVTNL